MKYFYLNTPDPNVELRFFRARAGKRHHCCDASRFVAHIDGVSTYVAEISRSFLLAHFSGLLLNRPAPRSWYNVRQAVGRVPRLSKISSQQLIVRFTWVVPLTDRRSLVHPIRVKLFCLLFTGKYVAKEDKRSVSDT